MLPLGRSELRHILAHILERLDLRGRKLELRITSDRLISQLYARHLGGAGPTNVLSFPVDEPGDGPNSGRGESGRSGDLGSIVLNADAVIREAWLYQQAPINHFIRLLTHALLHLADVDHGEVMDDLTESVVDSLGSSG